MSLKLFELNNYWLPLIWLFGAGLLLYAMPQKPELLGGRVVPRWNWFAALLLVLPLIIWAAARGYFGDTLAYQRAFAKAPYYLKDLSAYMKDNTEDWAFYLLMAVCKCLGVRSYTTFFLIIASIQMLCLVRTFRKYSEHYWLCIFLFVASTDYFSWMFNGMRQFMAAAIIFGAFDLLVKKRYVLYGLVIIIAAQFHASALIMLPLSLVMPGPPLNRKTMLMILGVAIVIPFIDRFMPILNSVLMDTQYSDITSNEIWAVDDGTDLMRVLVYSVPALIALFGYRYIRRTNDTIMHLCVNCAMITMAIYLVSSVTSGIYIGRLPIYTTFQGYMALPWMIDEVFEKDTARLIKLMMIVCYAGFYYFQMFLVWGVA